LGTILVNGTFNPQKNGQIFSEKFMLTIPSDAPKGKAQIGFSSGPFWHIMIPFKLERCLTFDVSGWKFSYCGAGQCSRYCEKLDYYA
jgi:hypothetical protein